MKKIGQRIHVIESGQRRWENEGMTWTDGDRIRAVMESML